MLECGLIGNTEKERMIKTMFGFGKNKDVKATEAENTNGKKNPAAEEKSEEEKVVITKDMLVTDALMLNPNLAPILMQAGMYCFSCPASMGETLEEAAMVHGFDVDDILEAVNTLDNAAEA